MVGFQNFQNTGIAVAVPMARLGEVPVFKMPDVADMGKCNAVAVLADDFRHVIVGVCVERAGAQGQAAVFIVHHGEEAVDALRINQQAGQPENIPGGDRPYGWPF